MYFLTTATKKIARLTKRIRIVQGGTSASKTVSVLIDFIRLSQTDTEPKVSSITSESMPHLRRGAMRDFINVMKVQGYWEKNRWNATQSFYTFETGSIMEFFGADNADKMRGGRRDRGFMNEANNCSFEAFDQFEVRTRDFVVLDYNPSEEFWAQIEIEKGRTDWEKVILTYKDNEALDQQTIDSIEQRKNRTEWWKVYGLGLLGEVEGKIYKDWKIINELPHEARLLAYGLDFGYTNDPSSIVAIYYLDGGYILHEVAYTKGLTNKQLADIILARSAAPVIADSAEPKSIDEMRLYGLTMVNATKGKGSVSQGIQFVQAQPISVTASSVNVIKEYRNYLWKTDRDGKVTNEPEHTYSHSMDAIRYGMQIKGSLTSIKAYVQPAYERAGLDSDRQAIAQVETFDGERPVRRA